MESEVPAFLGFYMLSCINYFQPAFKWATTVIYCNSGMQLAFLKLFTLSFKFQIVYEDRCLLKWLEMGWPSYELASAMKSVIRTIYKHLDLYLLSFLNNKLDDEALMQWRQERVQDKPGLTKWYMNNSIVSETSVIKISCFAHVIKWALQRALLVNFKAIE